MKKILALASLLVVSQAAFADGSVNFNNKDVSPAPLVTDASGANLVGQNYVAQLYFGAGGAAEGSLTAVATAASKFRVATTTLPGTWSGGTRTITGFSAGDTVTLQVRVWDTTFGADFATASAAVGAQSGASGLFTYKIPAATDPPAALLMTGLQAFQLKVTPPNVPEPSTLALGALGLGALLLRRRN